MSADRPYYYIRLKEGFFDSSELQVLESMKDGYLYSNILLKLYLKSLKNEGKLILGDAIPYNPEMIAAITRHQLGTVERALAIFKELGLIEILTDGTIYMLNIQEMIGKSSTEADRIRAYRSRVRKEKEALLNAPEKDFVQMYDECKGEIELEIEKELEIEEEENNTSLRSDIVPEEVPADPVPYQKIQSEYNAICKSLPKCTALSDKRKKAVKARWLEFGERVYEAFRLAEESDFLKASDGSWTGANFDWLMKPSNMLKVLEGNYANRAQNGRQKARDYNPDNDFSDVKAEEYTL